MNFLFAKNKVGFIDGSIKKPEKKAADYMPWMRCDTMVKGWLTTTMQKEIRNNVKYAAIAIEIWADLLDRFGKASVWDEMQSSLSIPLCTCGGCKCDMGKKIIEVSDSNPNSCHRSNTEPSKRLSSCCRRWETTSHRCWQKANGRLNGIQGLCSWLTWNL